MVCGVMGLRNERLGRQPTYLYTVVHGRTWRSSRGTDVQEAMRKESEKKEYYSWRYVNMAQKRPLTARDICWTKMHYTYESIYRTENRNRSSSLS